MASLAAITEAGMGDIVNSVRSLPPELHNYIYDLTFSTTNFEGNVCHVDENYKPPNILQVNRHWRSALSTAFYKDTIFTFTEDQTLPNNLSLFTKFFQGLPKERVIQATAPECRILSRSTKVKVRKADEGPMTDLWRIRLIKDRFLNAHDLHAVSAVTHRVRRELLASRAYDEIVPYVHYYIPSHDREMLVLNGEIMFKQTVALKMYADSRLSSRVSKTSFMSEPGCVDCD